MTRSYSQRTRDNQFWGIVNKDTTTAAVIQGYFIRCRMDIYHYKILELEITSQYYFWNETVGIFTRSCLSHFFDQSDYPPPPLSPPLPLAWHETQLAMLVMPSWAWRAVVSAWLWQVKQV